VAGRRRRLAAGGERLRLELDERLSARLDRIFRELSARFEPFFTDIGERRASLAVLRLRQTELQAGLAAFTPQ